MQHQGNDNGGRREKWVAGLRHAVGVEAAER